VSNDKVTDTSPGGDSNSKSRRQGLDVADTEQWTRPDLPQPIPAFSWQGALAPQVLLSSLLPLALALALPTDALDRWTWLKAAVDPFLAALPKLRTTAQATSFPQVALTVYCSVIAGSFVVALHFFVMAMLVNYRKLLMRFHALRFLTPIQLVVVGLGGPLVALGGLYVFLLLPGDPGFAEGLTTSSRFGLGIMAAIFVFIFGSFCGGAPIGLRLLVDVHVRRDRHE
jgi:hypothetical protein